MDPLEKNSSEKNISPTFRATQRILQWKSWIRLLENQHADKKRKRKWSIPKYRYHTKHKIPTERIKSIQYTKKQQINRYPYKHPIRGIIIQMKRINPAIRKKLSTNAAVINKDILMAHAQFILCITFNWPYDKIYMAERDSALYRDSNAADKNASSKGPPEYLLDVLCAD